MKGLLVFFRETWWVFGTAIVASLVIGYLTGMWLYYWFPAVVVPVFIYMGSVRYDSKGNLREETRRRQ